jgi:hypothetical protein
MLLADPSVSMPVVLQRYQWFYDKNINCLCVFPLMQNLSLPAQKLWKAFLKSISFLENQVNQTNHSFLFHPESVKKLISELKPQSVWICVDPQLLTETWDNHIYTSPSPELWLQKPLSKKHVWQIWQNILAA